MTPTLFRIGQIIGFIGICESIIIFVSTKRSRIIIFKFISDILWTTSYILCARYTAGVLSAIGMPREIVCYNREKHKWADNYIWIAVFILAAMISPVSDWVSHGGFYLAPIFPAIGTTLAVIGLYSKNPMTTKLFVAASQVLYIIYNCIGVVNYIGVAGSSVTLVSTLIGLVRELKVRKENASV